MTKMMDKQVEVTMIKADYFDLEKFRSQQG